LSNPQTGALAFDTECGVCRIYNGSSWPRISATYFSRFHGYRSATQAISSATWTTVALTSESYDSLNEISVSEGGIVTMAASGWYLIMGAVYWTAETSLNYVKIAGIYVGATRKTSDIKYGKEELVTTAMDIINLSAGDNVYLKAYQSYSGSVNILAATLILTRLS
jgi:hypothetical protein